MVVLHRTALVDALDLGLVSGSLDRDLVGLADAHVDVLDLAGTLAMSLAPILYIGFARLDVVPDPSVRVGSNAQLSRPWSA